MFGTGTRSATSLTVLAVILVLGCEREPPVEEIRLSSAPGGEVSQTAASQNEPLRMAVAPVISPLENVELYGPLLDHIASRLDRPVDFKQRPTYAEINALVRYGHADVAFVCDYAFVEGEDDFGMQILVVPQVMGKRTYQSYIIVPKDSNADDILDLRGKSFAFSDPLSSSGWLFPTHLLRQVGETSESFFSRHIFTGSHDNTVKAVARREVDGGAVDSLVYEYMARMDPTYREKTKVIQQSPLWGNPPVVVHPEINAAMREQLKEIFLTMHQNEQGKEVLTPLGIDQFFLPDDPAYDPVREMADEARTRIGETTGAEAKEDNKDNGQGR